MTVEFFNFLLQEMTYVMKEEAKGVGQCAFDPRHNSTYVFSGELHTLPAVLVLSVNYLPILMDKDNLRCH